MTQQGLAAGVAGINESTVKIATADGQVDTHLFFPRSADGASGTNGAAKRWPVVLFYMDGLGIRPDLLDMARRIAGQGYYVMLPDLYYRAAPEQRITGPVDFEKDPQARERIMTLVQSVTRPATMRDTRVFFEFLDRQPEADATRVGCVGYCMGGGLALSAAGTFPGRVVAAASIHGASLAIDRDDSPHKLAGSMRGKIYVGISEVDPYLQPGEMDLLEQTLKAAGVDHTMEVYPKVMHGFAVPGQAYDRDASERHWQRILGLFGETLRR